MSRSAMRYLVYGYIGPRTKNTSGIGIDKPSPGFCFCLYDSEQVHSESGCPIVPAIKNPEFNIEENSAGQLDFTLLADGETDIYYNATAEGTPVIRTTTLEDASHNPLPASPEKLFNYILPKQTEIVLYRRILKGQTYVTDELWAGRVDTVKKDFYNNWSIYAEGEMTYFNDVALSETKITNITMPERIFPKIIELYNARINAIPQAAKSITFTVLNPANAATDKQSYTVEQLPRLFNVGTVDTPTLPAVASSTDLDNTFTISDGSTAWGAIQSLLDKYGGHLEVRKDKNQTNTRFIDWRNSGTYNESEDRYNWTGYHTPDFNTYSQIIEFGVNLLDFSEEQDTSDMYTVLIPHGQAVVTTTTNEDGTTTSTTGPALTIENSNKLHPKTNYIYFNKAVQTYGWIEKVETWNVTNADTLYELALAYYRDLRIGSRNITIKAYDLKNLVNSPTELVDPAKLLAIDALYLYDVVYVRSDAHINRGRALIDSSQTMPIKGVKIPLDRFPTDTEYTISNGIKKRSILSPGTASQKQQQIPQPEETPGQEDPTQVTPEDPLPNVDPIGSTLGTDADFIHYPVTYLDRAYKYISAEIQLSTNSQGQKETATATVVGSLERYDWNRTNQAWESSDPDTGQSYALDAATYYMTNYKQNPQYTQEYYVISVGFNGDNATLSGGESIGTKTRAPGSVFFTDKLSSPDAMMRLRNNDENEINWYEKAHTDADPHPGSELQPFVSANSSYYSTYAEANVKPGQPWSGFASAHADAPPITWLAPREFNEGYTASNIIQAIGRLPFGSTTVGAIIALDGESGTRTQLMPSATSSRHLDLAMYYKAQGTGNEYTIRRQLIEWRPETFEAGYKYYYVVGIAECTGATGKSGLLYYTYFKDNASSTPIDADYWQLLKEQAIGEFVRIGFSSPVFEINVSQYSDGYVGVKYCHQVSVTHGSHTGNVWAACQESTPGAVRTYMYASVGGLYGYDVPGYPELNGLTLDNGFRFMDRIYDHGQSGRDILERVVAAYAAYKKVMADITAATTAVDAGKRLAEVKAKAAATPFLVVTTADSITDGTGYGVMAFSLLGGGTTLGLSYNSEGNYYTLTGSISNISPNASGTPIMICKDTLNSTEFLFYEVTTANPPLKVANPEPVITWASSSSNWTPITCMAKCGGLQTTYVAQNAYFRLSGDTTTSHCVGTGVIFPQLKDRGAPGSRNMVQRTTEGNHDKVWYDGGDMKTPDDYAGYHSMESASVEELSNYYFSTMGRQPTTIGGKYYARVTPTLFVEYQP